MEQTNEAYMAGQYPLALQKCREAEQMSYQVPDYPLDSRANIFRSKAHVFMALGQLDSGMVYTRKSLSAFRQSIGPAERLTIDVQYELGYFLNLAFDFDSAIYHYEACIDLYRNSIGDSTDDIPLTHNQIAKINFTLGLPTEAEFHAKEAYRLWVRNFGRQSQRGITASRLLGQLYWTMGQQSKGIFYYEEAVRSVGIVYKDNPSKQLGYYTELSRLYDQMGWQKQYVDWVQRADSIANIAEDIGIQGQATYLHAKSKFLNEERQQNQAAIQMMDEVIRLYQTIPFKQKYHYVNLADYNTSLSQMLKDAGQYEQAFARIDYAYSIYDSLYPTRRYYGHFERSDIAYLAKDTSVFLYNAANLIQFLVQTDEALSLPQLLKRDIPLYPHVNTLKASLRIADRLWQFYEQYPSDTHLELVQLAFEQLDRWYDPYHREEVQYNYKMAEHRSWIYKGLMRAYIAKYERHADPQALQLAFAASEQNKAFSLYKYIKQQSQLSFSGVPDSLVRREAGLKAKISFFNAKLNPSIAEDQYEKWQLELKDLQKEYEELTKLIQNQYPRYYQLLHQNPVLLQDFQAMLGPDEKGIIYTRADSVLYAFGITANSIEIQSIDFPASLVDSVLLFREHLFDHKNINQTDPEAFAHSGSYHLYQRLLAPLIGKQDWEMVYIIPDDILALIPFEVLWTEPSTTRSPQERPYLLRRYPIAYAYSASLCIEQQGVKTKNSSKDHSLAIFAPNYQEKMLDDMDTLVSKQLSYLVREGLYDLKGAQGEAEAISQYFDGTMLLGEDASKKRFLEIAPEFKLLHLAMHASVMPESPLLSNLIFADNPNDSLGRYLYAAELFALPLDAELVVLSACNTGYGKLEQGEGVMSLAKAFHYAGCPSVVMSLWQVPDQETQQLMTLFYAQLKAGKSKAEAMRSAKLAYIDQVKAPELAHPFFWAGFVLSGNAQPLEKDFMLSPWLLALLVMGVVGISLYWRTRQTSQSVK